MKIIISERQYKTLNEQVLLGAGLGLLPTTTKLVAKYPHEFAAVAGIASAFIPVVGPFISAGIGGLDALLHYKEGDKTSAGISAVFALLPFIGKIPGVKEAGSSVWKTIASKFASGAKLSQAETELVQQIVTNSSSIITLAQGASKKISPLVQKIKQFKPQYVERYGQDAYEKLMREFISGVSDQEYFLQSLQSAKKAVPRLANFVTKFGIKFGADEISQIQKIASEVLNDDAVKQVVVNSKAGPRTINVYTVSRELVTKKIPASANNVAFANVEGNAVYIIKDNVEDLTTRNIEDILTHEFAHIKDPSIVKSPAYIKKYSTEALKGLRSGALADKALKLGNTNRAQSLFNKWVKLYYLNPNEIIANNSMVLQNFATQTKMLGDIMNKNQLIGALDGVINWTKGSVASWSDDVATVLGYFDENISNHFNLLSQNPVEYRKFLAKLAQQAEYLKSQVKIAM